MKMKNETRLVKNLLQKHFPSHKCSIRFIAAKQYYTTSDKIRITVPQCIFEDAISVIRKNTKDIKISTNGYAVSASGITKPMIYNVATNTFCDVDMVEFIEVYVS